MTDRPSIPALGWFGAAARDLRAAATLLTRVPLGAAALPPNAREVWTYPVIGAAVGAAGALAYGAAHAVLTSMLAATVALGVTVALTGALHEDGLADTADGLFGGSTRARKLEIMRDSRIGTFGALALILSVALRVGALVSLDAIGRVAGALVVAGATGRAAVALMLAALPPARDDGMASGIHPTWRGGATAAAVSVVMALLLLGPAAALAATVAASAAGLGVAYFARRQIGGHTGDVLGATEQVVECGVLLVLAAATGYR